MDAGRFAIVVGIVGPADSLTLNTTATIQEELHSDGTPTERFLSELYRDLLHRPAEAGGFSFWTGLLNGGQTRTQVVEEIESCSTLEYRRIQVQDLFAALLHRSPDPSALSYDAIFLETSGTPEQLAASILTSPEYLQRNGTSNNSYLQALYHDVLHRDIDEAALGFWEFSLVKGASRAQVAEAILASDEYRGDVVQEYFQRFLDRNAEPAGFDFWLQELRQGIGDDLLLAGILGEMTSAEYFNSITGI